MGGKGNSIFALELIPNINHVGMHGGSQGRGDACMALERTTKFEGTFD